MRPLRYPLSASGSSAAGIVQRRTISAAWSVGLIVAVLLLGSVRVAAQNELSAGLDVETDQATSETLALLPWLGGAFSLSGYPGDALSWFVDGAGRGEYRSATGEGAFASTLLLTGSYRQGLSTLRVDLQGDADLSTGESPTAASGQLGLFASTGSIRSSVYGEITGAVDYREAERSWSARGFLGGSLTTGPRLAPDLRFNGGYSWLPRGEWQGDLGVTLTLPWYPAGPWSATAALGGLRSLGSTVGDVEGGEYYPDRHWDGFLDLQLLWSPRPRLLLDLLTPASFRLYDHGPVEGETMQAGREWLLSLAPGVRLSMDLTSELTLDIEAGGSLRWSNSPSAGAHAAYAGVALRYRFPAPAGDATGE